MERISQDSQRDHIAVMETLCAFVRENAPGADCKQYKLADGSLPDWVAKIDPPSAEIQAALSVIGRRSEKRIAHERSQGFKIDLRRCNLRKVDLRRARLATAWLYGSFLEDAQLDYADLSGAHLRKVHLHSAKAARTQFEQADLYKASMLDAICDNANFRGALLRKAQMNGAQFDYANFTDANLQKASLNDAYILSTSFQSANACCADFTEINHYGSFDDKLLETFFGCAGTVLPADVALIRPDHWSQTSLEDKYDCDEAYEKWLT